MRKSFCFVISILLMLVVCTSTYFGVRSLAAFYFGYKSNQLREVIANQVDLQDMLSLQVIETFLNYELAIADYNKMPNAENLVDLEQTTEKLNGLLAKASTVYGLSVKRWVDRFNVWQYQFQKTLSTRKDTAKNLRAIENSEVLFYENKINHVIKDAEDKYRLNTYNNLLYTSHSVTAPPALTKKIETIYQGEAKTLIPQAIRKLQQKTQSNLLSTCAGPESIAELTPKNVADNIVFLQYQSRFCPFSVVSTTEELCYQLTHSPVVENKEILVYCQIAEVRQQAAIKDAEQRYGKLSFAEYYEKYVEPLVPSYKMKLMGRVNANKNKSLSEVCDQKIQPVVAYRDPEVDAETAVYVLYGAAICKNQNFDLKEIDD